MLLKMNMCLIRTYGIAVLGLAKPVQQTAFGQFLCYSARGFSHRSPATAQKILAECLEIGSNP